MSWLWLALAGSGGLIIGVVYTTLRLAPFISWPQTPKGARRVHVSTLAASPVYVYDGRGKLLVAVETGWGPELVQVFAYDDHVGFDRVSPSVLG